MSSLIRTDVTAVKFHKHLVLAGIGSNLYLYDKKSATLMQKIECLSGQKVYGIVPSKCGEKILIFGGKQFTVLHQEGSDNDDGDIKFKRDFYPIVCDDWLHSAVWLGNDQAAVLTAHNVVQKWLTSSETLISTYPSKNNSILYSGLLLPLSDDVLVFAGTVFSMIIIHRCGNDKSLHCLEGHKGVIFSITCNPQKGIIVTTSDDRSVRIWTMKPSDEHNTIKYWENINIVCKYELYGHMARVMRSCITEDLIVSVGEDSTICLWDYEGNLLRKNVTHQNGCIWCIDCYRDHIVTGGGDSAVILHPLIVAKVYGCHKIVESDFGTPKKVVFTSRRNLVILNDNDEIIYYDISNKHTTVLKLHHKSSYKLLSVSSCKQLIAVGDMCGKLDVFSENCKGTPCIQTLIDTNLEIIKILSMHWAGNRYLVLCAENGIIDVLASKGTSVESYSDFILPHCKERWLTACSVDSSYKLFILGDRCGNIHIYSTGCKIPIKTFSKVHGRYGPTSINIRNDEIVTTGRDGTLKYFSKTESGAKFMSSRVVEFQWVEKFLDKDEIIVCGFHERVFVVHDVKNNSKILEVPCGGGHRSWDAIRYVEKINDQYEEFINLIYLKKSDIVLGKYQLNKIKSRNLISGSHSKEINCLQWYKTDLDNSITFYISGGEDTTLRISRVNSELTFQDDIVFKHLSSIRTLKIYPLGNNNLLLLSAGGRAQICIKVIHFIKKNTEVLLKSEEIVDFLVKGTDKERKGNKTWRDCAIDFDPETRIMDIDLIQVDEDFIIFAGCSDAYIRVYKFSNQTNTFHLTKEVNYHNTCILKVHCFQLNNKDVLITCTTRGEMAFWDVDPDLIEKLEFLPFFSTNTHKSGINSIDSKVLTNNKVLIVTGGDDNAIHLTVLDITHQSNVTLAAVLHSWSSDRYHSSQITGIVLLEDLLVATSIDQRITLLRWKVEEGIQCDFISQSYSDVADIQGMNIIHNDSDTITLCVFGKGFEVVNIPKVKGI